MPQAADRLRITKKHFRRNFEKIFKFLSHSQSDFSFSPSKKDYGVIVAPPGSGKTIIGLKIIADKQQPALIVVHRKQLLEQWIERVEAFLGIPKKDIGFSS